jgi:AraC-like DNA-binding protein
MNTRPTPRLEDDGIIYTTFNGEDIFNKTIKCTYFLVVLFLDGAGVHSIDGIEYPIHKNQLHFLFPGQHHHWETDAQTRALQIVVGKELFLEFSSINELLFIKNNFHPIFRFNADKFKAVHNEMTAIKTDLELLKIDAKWRSILQMRMNIISSIMKREAEHHIEKATLSNLNATIKKYWSLLDDHFKEQKEVTWYADRLYVTANYLNILCKRNLNTTASELILQRITQEAKQLLRFSTMSIKEISFDLGFGSASSFSVFFRKKSGFSPTEYRSG